MARAIWSGSISFGLLNVPVRLYSAVARRSIALREIRESDGARIRHRRVAEGTDEEVPYEDIVKAFEITPGHYVPLSKDELASLDAGEERARSRSRTSSTSARSTRSTSTAPTTSAPPTGAEKAYSLLARAMAGSGKVAIARFVLRNKEHLAAIRPAEGVLTLTTMRFADEVVPPDELRGGSGPRRPEAGQARGRDGRAADRLADQRASIPPPTATSTASSCWR